MVLGGATVKVNDDFAEWLNRMYGQYGEVKCVRGKRHDFLGMTLDWSFAKHMGIDMRFYIIAMCNDFETDSGIKLGTAQVPAPTDLLSRGTGKSLDAKRAKLFHTYTMKDMYACKRGRPDIHTAIAILCTRVRDPYEDDWRKFLQMMKYCNATRKDILWLSVDNIHGIKWHVDASFAVHPDFKSHTGAP